MRRLDQERRRLTNSAGAVGEILEQVSKMEINRRNEEGETPLSLAAELGHEEIVRILLDKGADASAQGGYYGNAL
jgi:ankyrin repeat protein